jgi:hypothetical protein
MKPASVSSTGQGGGKRCGTYAYLRPSWNAIFLACVQIFDYCHIRSTLLATSILLEIDRDLPEIESLGRSLQCFGSNA